MLGQQARRQSQRDMSGGNCDRFLAPQKMQINKIAFVFQSRQGVLQMDSV